MAIQNAYNPKPMTVDDVMRRRQSSIDLQRESGLIQQERFEGAKPQANQRVLGVEITPNYEGKSFLRKVGEDAAMLAYALPVGVAKLATGAVTDPLGTGKEVVQGLWQGVKDAVDPDYYKAHPLLGIVNLAGFVAPVAGAAKSAAVKTATNAALNTAVKTAVVSGADDVVVRTALNTGLKKSVFEMLKSGNPQIVTEVARTALTKAGIADDVALRTASDLADSLVNHFSRQSTKMKVLESLTHPLDSSLRYVTQQSRPLRQAVFGKPAETAVAKIYGADVVKKNPEAFYRIEQWAEMQVNERGMDNTVANRQRIMQEWTDQNTQWASLTPEQRISHFNNYAEQDLIRKQLHDSTGLNIVTTKALPQHYVDAMVDTIKAAPDGEDLMKYMADEYADDFNIHSAEITQALAGKEITKEALIEAVSKLGSSRSNITFAKFAPEVQNLAKELEGTGYRIGIAPSNKPVSFATDIMRGVSEVAGETVKLTPEQYSAVTAARSTFGRWIEKLGLSSEGVIEGAPEFAYKEGFIQHVLNDVVPKHGSVIKIGKISVPAEQIFNWIDRNKFKFQQARPKSAATPLMNVGRVMTFQAKGLREGTVIRTVFDVKAEDLVRAGLEKSVAESIEAASRKALREVPASVVGMGDKVINYLRTSNKGFGKWMSDWYDGYLKTAYQMRYDWSPFFSAQQYLETKLNSALLLKDARLLPGGKAASKLGAWGVSKLGKKLESTKTYLSEIIDEPPLDEIAAVKEEILGTLQKTMLDYNSTPDIINIQNAAKNAYELLRDKAAFEESIRSRNIWYAATGQSTVRMATTFSRALAQKFGMTIKDALDFTIDEAGNKVYKNPKVVQLLREANQDAFHYRVGALTSPLMKTLNVVWFPLRFQAKTVQMLSQWMYGLSPTSRLIVLNNWAHFANWASTEEGIKWRRTNRNMLYSLLSYTTAYEQMGQTIEAVTKGRLFGGNAGLIGGVPFGALVNVARELAILPEDPDQFDPKTGRPFKKDIPKQAVSAATLAVAAEQLLISMTPSTPFYSLTGGSISGVSTRKFIESLVRQVVGGTREAIEGRDPAKGRQMLERDFKRVPLDYSRLSQ